VVLVRCCFCRAPQPRRAAIREFVQTADPEDEFSLTLVRDSPKPEVGLSDEPDRLLDRVDQTVSGGLTALRDATYFAAQQLKRARHPRRAMRIVSDGADNNSRYRSSEVRSLLREMDITVYVVGVHSGSSRTSAADLYDLQCLAKETGGRYFDAYSARDSPRIMERLDIRNQYVLAYTPRVPRLDGKYHRVRVEVDSPGPGPGPNLSWRRGYIAPSAR
jgi:Ca-activated chloride channel family protein